MPRLQPEIKERIRQLSHDELLEIVLKLSAKEKSIYEFVVVNYLEGPEAELELYDDVIDDLEMEFTKRRKGYAEQMKMYHMMVACIKRINEFVKISKDKTLEAKLLMHVLEVPFGLSTNMFGTCFSQYDTKVALIVKRLITLLTKKMHEDYRVEYQERINEYLTVLHRCANHIDTVRTLPKSI